MQRSDGLRVLFGLLGHPLSHSFSRSYFEGKFVSGPDGGYEYRNFDFPDLEEGVRCLKSNPFLKGFNVTLPYKKSIMPYLDEVSPEAAAIGAVNTVCVQEGTARWTGFNTDTSAFWDSLSRFAGRAWLGGCRKALVLGNGGASQAVQYAFHVHGIRYDLVCRNPSASSAGSHALFRPERIWRYPELAASYLETDVSLIVNATSLGMFPDTGQAPPIPYEGIGENHVAFDLVYNPLESLFLQKCRRHHARCCNGLDMLHLQAEASWETWMRGDACLQGGAGV